MVRDGNPYLLPVTWNETLSRNRDPCWSFSVAAAPWWGHAAK